nr:hypothetical protein [Tanacetum cinerariifolium]
MLDDKLMLLGDDGKLLNSCKSHQLELSSSKHIVVTHINVINNVSDVNLNIGGDKLSGTGETKSYANLLNGEFRLNGKMVVYAMVENYVKNAWRMFKLVHTMVNVKGSFFFKFNSNTGMDGMLESVPWLICNVTFILRKWSFMTNVSKEDLKSVLVLVKLHDDLLTGFEKDRLSVIAKKLGTLLMLDTCTTFMCMELWVGPTMSMNRVEGTQGIKKMNRREIVNGVKNQVGGNYGFNTKSKLVYMPVLKISSPSKGSKLAVMIDNINNMATTSGANKKPHVDNAT